MKSLKCILLTLALSGFASVASAQDTGVDSGSTAPTPGPSDVSQLLTTGDTVALPDSGSLNQFYDNTTPGYVGTSFTTGANPGGYTMTRLAFKFGGGQPVGYAGGNDVTLDPGWIITIYQLSGTGHTTATGVYTNTTGALAGTANTGADWIEITNFPDLTLLPNAVYAWTIFQPNGYDDLAYATGTPYTGGTICQIPAGGGTVTYASDPDSATFDVGLSAIALPLVVVNLGANVNPTPGPNDIYQLLYSGTSDDTDGINYYDNNSGGSTPGASGQSFTTGSNPGGYLMDSLTVKFNGDSYGGDDAAGSQSWRIVIFRLSGAGDTTATPIATNTSEVITTSSDAPGDTSIDWLAFTGMYVPLLPNTVYAYTFDTASSPSYSGYDGLGDATVSPYTNGVICRIEDAGGTVTYYASNPNTASFDIGLGLQGFPSVGIASATPNPCYALSPVSISDTGSGPGTLTYQWQTNSDLTGSLSGTWANVPNATNLNLLFTPTVTGILDFQFIVQNSAGSVTSAPVALTINPAQAPSSSTGVAPAAITTYPGATVSFSDTSFVGTTPISYQWQLNSGSGYTNILSTQNPSATNTTLNLTDVLASEAGSYQLVATSSQGSANDSSVGVGILTLLTPPPLPVSTSPQNVPYLEYSNAPYAYWRLQETSNPASAPPTVIAYDSSGHGFDADYGASVTTSNAGPEAPFFPGFSSNELAAGTSLAAGGFLTVPPLNLNTTTNVSFIAWINPNQGQASSTGLLFSRDGSDASGFGFNGNPNGAGMPCLGFTWNSNSSATWGWNSGLYPVVGLWSLVAYVITPTSETTYLFYVDTTVSPYKTNFLQNSISLANMAEAFSVTSDLGSDPQAAARTFSGSITEAALYTNSLSQQEVVNIFLAAIGSSTAPVSPPLTLPSPSLFAGESYQLNGTAGGSTPISYQWKSSSDGGVAWANVPANANYSGVTSPILQINDATVADALEYEVVAMNSASTATSGVSTVSITPVPTGLWTANFQLTNATAEYGFVGVGSYTGHGVLGTGTYWNPIGDPNNAFVTGTYTNETDFEDDGATPTGISVTVSDADGFTSTTSQTPPSSIQTFLGQYVQFFGTITLDGVPDGTYNFAVYSIDGSFANDGENITLDATNGPFTQTCVNQQDGYFAPNDNTEIFTNVQAVGGTLSVTMTTVVNNPDFCGLQIQLVSYAATVDDIPLGYAVTNNALTLSWSEGLLQSATNVAGPWVTLSDPSPLTVTMTNASQFYRLMIPKP